MKLLRREEAAQYLKSKRLRASKIMLARHAMFGKGVKYTIIGRTAYCTEEWLDEWLKSQLKPDTHAFAYMRS